MQRVQQRSALYLTAAGVLVFLLMVSCLKAVTLEDAISLGLSEKLAKKLQKLHILS